MAVFGVDGCRKGWFFVSVEHDRLDFGVVAELAELVARTPGGSSMFVDIPIGLRDDDATARGCDTEARKYLGPRASSVFPAPTRAILHEENYAAALKKSRKVTGKGFSKQVFFILPKIREVDTLLGSDTRARAMVRESHPELCFWALAGGRPMAHKKKLTEGFVERMAVLEKVMPGARDLVDAALQRYQRSEVLRDDIVDALVTAATAASEKEYLLTLPERPARDSTGLPMEMVYSARYLTQAGEE